MGKTQRKTGQCEPVHALIASVPTVRVERNSLPLPYIVLRDLLEKYLNPEEDRPMFDCLVHKVGQFELCNRKPQTAFYLRDIASEGGIHECGHTLEMHTFCV